MSRPASTRRIVLGGGERNRNSLPPDCARSARLRVEARARNSHCEGPVQGHHEKGYRRGRFKAWDKQSMGDGQQLLDGETILGA